MGTHSSSEAEKTKASSGGRVGHPSCFLKEQKKLQTMCHPRGGEDFSPAASRGVAGECTHERSVKAS